MYTSGIIEVEEVVNKAIRIINISTQNVATRIQSAAEKIMTPRVITINESEIEGDTPPNPFSHVQPNNNYFSLDLVFANLIHRPENNARVIDLQKTLRNRLTQSEDFNNVYNFVFFNAANTNISEQLLNYICHEKNPGIVPNDNNNINPEEQLIKEQKIEILALNTLMQALFDEFITSNSNTTINVQYIENLSCEGLQYIFIEMIHPRFAGDYIEINKVLKNSKEQELTLEEFDDINNFNPKTSVLNYFEAINVTRDDIRRKLSILNAFLSTTSKVADPDDLANSVKTENERLAEKAQRDMYKDLKKRVSFIRKQRAILRQKTQKANRGDIIEQRRRGLVDDKIVYDEKPRSLAGGKTMKKQVRKSSRKQVRKSSRKQMKKQVRKSKQSLKKKARK
jgi:hypothetical protein